MGRDSVNEHHADRQRLRAGLSPKTRNGLLLCSALLFVAAWLIADGGQFRNRSERVYGDLPVSTSDWVIREDRLFWPGTRANVGPPAPFLVQFISLGSDGASTTPRPLFRYEQMDRIAERLAYTSDAVYFATYPFRPQAGGTFRGGGGRPVKNLGEFILPRENRPPAKGEVRRVLSSAKAAPRKGATLHRVSLVGGGATSSIVPLQGADEALASPSWQIAGGALYWIRQRPGPAGRTVENRDGFRLEKRADNDLMASPLDGGPCRNVATGLPENLLPATEDGVFWVVPHVYPDTSRDLFCLRRTDLAAATPRPVCIRDYSGEEAPIRYGERWYWIESRRDATSGKTIPGNLVSARLDGSERRVERRQQSRRKNGESRGRGQHVALVRHQGRLYLFLATQNNRRGVPSSSSTLPGYYDVAAEENRTDYALACFRPERAEPVGEPVALPGLNKFHLTRLPIGFPRSSEAMAFDEKYLYYTVRETRANLLDAFFARSTARSRTVLYRAPPPLE